MIELLSFLSVFLGHILQIAAELAIAGLAIYGFIKIVSSPSSCSGDCNQGRNCDCKGKDNGIS